MSDFLEILGTLLLPMLLLGVAFFAGNVIASRHEQSLAEREKAVGHIRTTDLSLFFHPSPAGSPARLFTAEVTLGIDHFRGYLGSLKNIFGGEIRSYQKTLDRARREALMRVVEQAHAEGYNAIANVRLEFVDVSGSANMAKRPAMVSILASGTAYITKSPLNGEERPVIPPPVIV